jgi:hypothetical protein
MITPAIPSTVWQRTRWAAARLSFIIYIVLSMVTLVGGFLTAPLMTWYFFGDWRFWRHLRPGLGLLPHGLRLLRVMFVQGQAFMFSVPLTSPPLSRPDPALSVLRGDWAHGSTCGDCNNCCRVMDYVCPLLKNGRCRGYDSFYWRYFNCGRFPSTAPELEYYACPKWAFVSVPVAMPGEVPNGLQPEGSKM